MLHDFHNKCDFKLNFFEAINNPKVLGELSVIDALNKIKNGDENLPLIIMARNSGKQKNKIKYDSIKKNLLPTFRFNFRFKNSANNQNISNPVGVIYIDVDNANDIPNSEYILARWRSLSNNGYGILVKVENLTLANFNEVYDNISSEIGVEQDIHARKPIQQTVLSYDPTLYFNCSSKVYIHEVKSKVHSARIIKEKECLQTDCTFDDRIKFDNSGEYFKSDIKIPYKFFEEKENLAKVFVPFKPIYEGKRNSIMFTCIVQFAVLNPNAERKTLIWLSSEINKMFVPPLHQKEVRSIIESVIKKRKDGSLIINYNSPKRFVFNPQINIPKEYKTKIIGMEMGRFKREKAMLEINTIIEDWDFNCLGVITQKKVAETGNMSLRKIKTYWSVFKNLVSELNKKFDDSLIPSQDKRNT